MKKFKKINPPSNARFIIKKDQKFGNWSALFETEPRKYYTKTGNVRYKRLIVCKCTACNKTIVPVLLDSLRAKSSLHCGCLQPSQVERANTKHGYRKTALHKIYYNMLNRCYNSKNRRYADYGGRGIKVCKEWRNGGLKVFGDWCMANGYKEGLQLDRRKNNKHYGPSNCRFVTRKKNINNTRRNLYVEYKGKRYSFARFWEKFNKDVQYGTALHRYKKGVEPIKAVTLKRINSYDV